MDDLGNYQSAETVWRWESRLRRARDAYEEALKAALLAEQETAWLLLHPPMYHLFNWSA